VLLQRRRESEAVTWDVELDTLKRLIALRRQGKVGIIHADGGRYAISDSPVNIQGSKQHYTVGQLREMVVAIEGGRRN
jgi:hypothetical protein